MPSKIQITKIKQSTSVPNSSLDETVEQTSTAACNDQTLKRATSNFFLLIKEKNRCKF